MKAAQRSWPGTCIRVQSPVRYDAEAPACEHACREGEAAASSSRRCRASPYAAQSASASTICLTVSSLTRAEHSEHSGWSSCAHGGQSAAAEACALVRTLGAT